jgi:hypothetical protein
VHDRLELRRVANVYAPALDRDHAERISAELGFVTYVEGLRQAIEGAAGDEYEK